MAALSFHFHGYQPGDLVRWLEPDPLKPQRFEERASPVALRIGGENVAGANWTDAVLRAYGRLESVFERVPHVASVDIEPQSLAWLLARDPAGYRRALAAWESATVGFVLTPPFHPILPHHHRLEREAVFAMMIDFFAPILRRVDGPIGLWLPETVYSTETVQDFLAESRRAAPEKDVPELSRRVHLFLDARQVASAAVSAFRIGIDGGLTAIAREPGMSGRFAFGSSDVDQFVSTAKERTGSLLVASDLESLLANPAAAERFEAIVSTGRAQGLAVNAPSAAENLPAASVVEHSSWSDYDDQLFEGHTSDTRWTGMRRSDGLVVSRTHRGEPMSQLWKHAFTLATEVVETAVRRTARDVLRIFELERRRDVVRRIAVAYGRHLWHEHYRATGSSSGDVDLHRQLEMILGGKVDVEGAAYLARAYVAMLMGLRSDPRFWDNPDTRVTFQNVVCLAQSLLDAAEVWRRFGHADEADRVLRLLRATLFEFADAYARGRYGSLHGAQGWETSESAWLHSLQSEVPSKSHLDVFRRATLVATTDASHFADGRLGADELAVADAGHIVGEAHGEWANREWCEHKT